jgi:hypothetical protein
MKSNMKERIHLFEEDSRMLEALAKSHREGSKEHTALRHATIALWYALTEGHDRFQQYIDNFHGELTIEQRAHLIQMGIDPDGEPPSS